MFLSLTSNYLTELKYKIRTDGWNQENILKLLPAQHNMQWTKIFLQFFLEFKH